MARRVLEKTHPLVDATELPLAAAHWWLRRYLSQQLAEAICLSTTLPETVDDGLLVPDDAITLAVARGGSLPSRPQADEGRPPCRVALLPRHRVLGQGDQLLAFLRRDDIFEDEGGAALVLGERGRGPVDVSAGDGRCGGRGQEGVRDGDVVVGVLDLDGGLALGFGRDFDGEGGFLGGGEAEFGGEVGKHGEDSGGLVGDDGDGVDGYWVLSETLTGCECCLYVQFSLKMQYATLPNPD